MAEEEKVYDSGPAEADDELWLGVGRKMAEESMGAVRDGAKGLMTALGVLQGIYVGILGLGDFVPEGASGWGAAVYALPLALWLVGLYLCMSVMMPEGMKVNLRSPDDIRAKSEAILKWKQREVQGAFWLTAAGLLVAATLIIFGL